jgi:ribosomal protein L16 Arg81 hydroxylase
MDALEQPSSRSTPLERLLAPLEPAVFFRDVWERQHYLLRRGAPGRYADLLALDDVDVLIGLSGIVAPPREDIRFVKKAADGPALSPTTHHSIAGLHDVYRAYARGCTVIVNFVDQHWAPVAALCRGLETVFQCRVNANLYLTPRQAQGFAAHYDTHDVFVLQLAGSKTWRLYGAVAEPLPLPDAVYEGIVPPELLGTPTEECRLDDGDVLYLPRGHVHEALTSTASSLHLTVGVHVTRWADLLCAAIMQAAERDVALREAVPPDWLTGQAAAERVHRRLRELLGLVAADVPTASMLERRARRFLVERPPAVEGHFRNLDRLGDLTLHTRVRRRAGVTGTVFEQKGSAGLQFGGNAVRGPDYIAPQLRYVAENEAFTVEDLPDGLTDNGKIVLVRRLVREGFLAVEPPAVDALQET